MQAAPCRQNVRGALWKLKWQMGWIDQSPQGSCFQSETALYFSSGPRSRAQESTIVTGAS